MQTESVTPELLETLYRLQKLDGLSAFSLGGGTSLALRYGHRKSVDIDLFSVPAFEPELLLHEIRGEYSSTEIFNRTAGSLCLGIDGVKVDILHHAYGELESPEFLEGIRCVSLPDLAAMKINAVTNRGSRKDFSDLLLLHQNGIPLGKALELFCAKYGDSGKFLAIKSLSFFDDAHGEPEPVYLNGWTWDYVETEMSRLAQELL